jgi:ribosomal peptide maturation radical SAM protein 1
MAHSIVNNIPEIDVVFSGESELSFTRYLSGMAAVDESKVLSSKPNSDLQGLPENDYSEYFEQLEEWIPDSIVRTTGNILIPYESSRGCWWGAKHHCTFCGLNALGMGFREKTAEKVIEELVRITERHRTYRICMVDNIMPFRYFESLLPRLSALPQRLDIFYEQKANISREKMCRLKAAGINTIQPGIEALDDDLLSLMRKGVTAKQNVILLRYARAYDIGVSWNLLGGFPGDRLDSYERTLRIIQLIRHLQPPSGLCKLSLDRFSPYFERPDEFGITDVRPVESYQAAFAHFRYVSKLSYHHEGCIPTALLPGSEIYHRLIREIDEWKSEWEDENRPILYVCRACDGRFVLVDTRSLSQLGPITIIEQERALSLLSNTIEDGPQAEWAKANLLAMDLSGECVSLVVPDLNIIDLSSRAGRSARY